LSCIEISPPLLSAKDEFDLAGFLLFHFSFPVNLLVSSLKVVVDFHQSRIKEDAFHPTPESGRSSGPEGN
jgi:hypothetical protein